MEGFLPWAAVLVVAAGALMFLGGFIGFCYRRKITRTTIRRLADHEGLPEFDYEAMPVSFSTLETRSSKASNSDRKMALSSFLSMR